DLLDDLRPAGERFGRALGARELEPGLGEIDAEDPLRSAQPAADDGAEPDEARAEDDARRAGLDLGGVERCADSGREATGEDARAVQRRLWSDLRKRNLRHHGVLGEGGRPHEMPDRLAVAGQARRPVREEALVLLLTDREAEVGARVLAMGALPA